MAIQEQDSTAEPFIVFDEDGEGTFTMQRRHGSVRVAVNYAGAGGAVYLDRATVRTIAAWMDQAADDCGNFAELDAPEDDDDDDDEPDDETGERDRSQDSGWFARIQLAQRRLRELNGAGR